MIYFIGFIYWLFKLEDSFDRYIDEISWCVL